MNNKGYTLVELIATVVILSIVMGIVANGVIGIINRSKEKSEKIFVDKLENVIQTYINNNRLDWQIDNSFATKEFNKCRRIKDDGDCYSDIETTQVDLYKIKDSFSLSSLEDDRYIKGAKIINPKNKKNCLSDDKNALVDLYKDSDSVYYYYVDLENLACEITKDYAIVSNIPRNMCISLDWNYDNDKEMCVKK